MVSTSRNWNEQEFFFKNWLTFNLKNGVHELKKSLNKSKRFAINQKPFPLPTMKVSSKIRFHWTKRLLPFKSVSDKIKENGFH